MNLRPVVLLVLLSVTACTGPSLSEKPTFTQTGIASWYGAGHHGLKTASGTRFNMHAMTAAHRSLPFSTVARVTSLDTGKSVRVRIDDRGPFIRGRIIDLSSAAASAIGMSGGLTPVRVEVFKSDQ